MAFPAWEYIGPGGTKDQIMSVYPVNGAASVLRRMLPAATASNPVLGVAQFKINMQAEFFVEH